MLNNQKIIVIMSAYNAGKTLGKAYAEIPFEIIDGVTLTGDFSTDNTLEVVSELGIKHIFKHETNKGYCGNQKSCYNKALELNADIVIMLHPDYQYTPKLIGVICNLTANKVYPVVFGSRISGTGALKGEMPIIKYIANRCLTFFQNILLNQKLSEHHTGYRGFTSTVLKGINFNLNSDDFIFDNQMLAKIIFKNHEIAEITCPTKYFDFASLINLKRSFIYGLSLLKVSIMFRLAKWNISKSKIFNT